MNKRKGLHKIISVILIVALVLPILPDRTIKAAEDPDFNFTGDVSTVSPAAITVMAAEDANTTLNVMDGSITVTNQSYVQKNSVGTIVSQGDIVGELVLTGYQNSGFNVNILGSNIPAIKYKDVTTNGGIYGTATGVLNVIIEGNCTFNSSLLSGVSSMTTVNVTGTEGNLFIGSSSISLSDANNKYLNIDGINFKTNGSLMSIANTGGYNISVTNCTHDGSAGGYLRIFNYVSGSNYTCNAVVKDCVFDRLALNFSTNALIENVVVLSSESAGTFNATGVSNCELIIKDSNLKFSLVQVGGSIFKILNSRVEIIGSYFGGTYADTLYVEGSTIIINYPADTLNFRSKSTTNLCLVDNSINFISKYSATNNGFTTNSSVRYDPVDNFGHALFLNKVKIPGASDELVTVSIDGRTPVNLWTDVDGYLYLYLPAGEHTVAALDSNGIGYIMTFTAFSTRETSSTTNIAGEMTLSTESTDILTPYINSAIQYSFDNKSWINATTDANGVFKAIIPNNVTRAYIRLISTGEIKHAVITDGGAGIFYDAKPIITEQSNSEQTFIKGLQGTVYVTSVPYTIGNKLTYQWYKNGEILIGKTSTVLNLSAAQVTDAGTYTCVITESDGRTITSSPITVIIEESQPEESGELKIISQSYGKALIKGYSTELYVYAIPTLSIKVLTYQWYKDGEEIAGATDSKLILNSVELEDSGSYVCRVYEDSDYINSDPILVTVENNPLEGDVTDLNNQVSELTLQVESLTDRLNTANREKETLQDTIDRLESHLETYTNLITELQGNITDLEQELQDSEGNNETLNRTVLNLNNQITILNQQISSLQADLQAANKDKEILEGTVTDLQNDIINLNGQITILEGKLADSEAENTELVNRVTELHNTISGLESDITNLQSDLDTLNNNYTSLQGQLETANNTISSLKALLVLIKGELGVVNDDEIIPAIQQLKAQLQQESANNVSLQEQLNDLNTELLSAKDSNSSLTEKLQELMDLVDSEDIDGIRDKILALQTAITESETRINVLEQEKRELLISLEEAADLNHSLQQKIDELLELSDSDVEELKRKVLDLTDEINQVVQNNKDLQDSINNLNTQVIEINTEKAALESEIVRLETLLETANSTIEELRQQLADMAAGKNVVESENSALKVELEKLKQQLENNNNSGNGNSGNSGNSSEIKELRDKLDQALSNLENTKNELEKLQESSGGTDSTETGDTEIKIPENSVVVLPVEKIDEPVIKEYRDKPVSGEKIIAEEGWEIAPTLESVWAKEIDLVDVVGQSNKQENVDYSFYAREEDKPEQVYTQTVNVEKPVAIPNFTMDKLIYLGSDFNLNVANVPEDAKVTYKSADSSIAQINKSGTITPIKDGKTKIDGTVTKDGISYRFTVNVTVKDGVNRTLNLKDQAVQTSSNNPVLLVYKLIIKDKTTKINLKGYANNATVSYISSDSSIATVNKDGVIKGVKKGDTTITATLAQNNTIYTYIIKVRVDDGTIDNRMWDYLTAA